MEPTLSPREAADALGVSESSVKRWVDNGELSAARTAGGHRRILRSEVLRFARSRGSLPARPDLLSLPSFQPEEARLGESARSAAFYRALLQDDRPRALGLLTTAFVAGASVASLCDGPIRQSLERIGELWRHDDRGILCEHRATDLCLHALAALRALLPSPGPEAPAALGGGGLADPYLLPGMMCAASLAEVGFRDVNLGPFTPVAAVLAAVETYRPLLVWHTASIPGDDLPELAAALPRLVGAVPGREVRLVAGGRALAGMALPPGVLALKDMGELQAFARGLLAARSAMPLPDGSAPARGAARRMA